MRLFQRLPQVTALQDTTEDTADKPTQHISTVEFELAVVPIITARPHAVPNTFKLATPSRNLARLIADLGDIGFSTRNGSLGQLDLLDQSIVLRRRRLASLLIHGLQAFLGQGLCQDGKSFLMSPPIPIGLKTQTLLVKRVHRFLARTETVAGLLQRSKLFGQNGL